MNGAVGEAVGRDAQELGTEYVLVRQSAESQDATQVGHRGKLGGEEAVAGARLGRRREVCRGHAAHGVDDPAAGQFEAVVDGGGIGSARQTGGGQGLIEQPTGVVAREGAAGAVCTFDAGRHADDEDRGIARPPARDGGIEPGGLVGPVAMPVIDEARTQRAVTVRFERGRRGEAFHASEYVAQFSNEGSPSAWPERGFARARGSA